MTKISLLLCTSVATLSLANSAFAQSERLPHGTGGGAPAAKEMAPSSAGEMPASRSTPTASEKGLERGSTSADRGNRPDAHDRSGESQRANDSAKSKTDRDGSATNASKDAVDRDTVDSKDESNKRSKNAADSKSMTKDGASAGASEGTAASDKPPGSVTQLSGEQRTKVQSAFRSHRSEAVVKDIDIDISIGIGVPRSVSLYAVPQDVVIIVPEYRRYKYFVFDDKIVIVDPGTYEIVDVLVLV